MLQSPLTPYQKILGRVLVDVKSKFNETYGRYIQHVLPLKWMTIKLNIRCIFIYRKWLIGRPGKIWVGLSEAHHCMFSSTGFDINNVVTGLQQ